MKKRSFSRYLFALTVPIIIQNLITTSLNLVDTFMIGQVGETELAAVGIANQYYFLFSLFIFGVSGGAAVLIAQLWGKKDMGSIQKVLAHAMKNVFFITLIFVCLAGLYAESIIALFNSDHHVIHQGSAYLRITLIGYFFTSLSFILASALRSINNTKMPMYASLFGLVANVVFNYILIFGHLGFDPMHVRGAALATVISRTLECFILVLMVLSYVPELKLKISDFFGFESIMKKTLRQTTLPILFNEACWGLGMVTYVSLYSNLGISQAASMQISSTIINLFMVVAFGLAYSALVIVGNDVGAGEFNKAYEASEKIRSFALKVGTCLSVILFVSAPFIILGFNVTEEVAKTVTMILRINSLMFPLRMINMIMIVGILRGGGDAMFSTALQGSVMWGLGIPLTYLVAYVFRYPLPIVISVIFIEEVFKAIIIRKRFQSKKWIRAIVAR